MKYLVLISLFSLSLFAQENTEIVETPVEDLEVVEFEEIAESDIPAGESVEEVEAEEDYLAPFEQEATAISEPAPEQQAENQPLLNQSVYRENTSYGLVSNKSLLFRDKIRIGYDTARWDYEEFVGGETFMKDGGQLHGFKADFESLIQDSSAFWNLSVRFLTGKTLYEGGDTSGRKFNLESKNSITEFSTSLGYAFTFSDNVFFKPSLGLSYRILTNPKNEQHRGSYSREAKYFTVPLTTELAIVATENFNMGLGTHYNFLIQANTESKLSETTSVFRDINNEQNKGKGYGAYLNLRWLLSKNSINFSPYYRVWDFQDSESVFQQVTNGLTVITYGFREPENKTKEIGANLTIGF